MKFCEICGEEISTRDGENRCDACENIEFKGLVKRSNAKTKRKERENVLKSLGLTKVRGALGGTYWE